MTGPIQDLSTPLGPVGPADERHYGEHESEVVPIAAVVDLVDVDAVLEQRDDERHRCDQPVPETEPEPGHITVGVGDADRLIGPGRNWGTRGTPVLGCARTPIDSDHTLEDGI